LIAWTPLHAQHVSLQFGGARTEYADTISGTAGVASGRTRWSFDNAALNLDASFSQFTSGEWVVQGSGATGAMWLVTPHFGAGFSGAGNAHYLGADDWSGIGSAGPMAALVLNRTVVSAGVTFGGVRRVDQSSESIIGAHASIDHRLTSGRIKAGISGTLTDTLAFADFTASGTAYIGPRITVDVLGGFRAGDLADHPWGQASIELEVIPQAILEAAVGNYPSDLAGFTDGFFVTAGFRLVLHEDPATRRNRNLRRPAVVERLGANLVRVRLSVPNAERVEILGEWNDWTAVPMRRVGNDWTVDIALPTGAHRFTLRVNGSRIMVPEGVLTMPDEFGGETGLLIVGESS
jgi:hypothetical protein